VSDQRRLTMRHSEELYSIETTLTYVEQQREVTDTDILLCRKVNEGSPAANNYHSFLKKKFFHLQIYITLNTIFVCKMFSCEAVLYSLQNLIIS
jgi:hypothetical protein